MKKKKKKEQVRRAPDEEYITDCADADQLISEHDKWVFQSLRMAWVASKRDDLTFKKVLADKEINLVKLWSNWITALDLFEKNAELLKRTILRAAALRES